MIEQRMPHACIHAHVYAHVHPLICCVVCTRRYSSEINLSVHIPPGTRARDLVVVVQPFQISISLKGYGVILAGSFHKGTRAPRAQPQPQPQPQTLNPQPRPG